MNLLLDGNAVLRAVYAPSTLSPGMRSLLQAHSNVPYLSYATVWELLAKIERKRILIVPDTTEEAYERIVGSGVLLLPVKRDDLVRAAMLPDIHRDPFDRMLIAQAQRLGATIVSSDRVLHEYDVPVLAL